MATITITIPDDKAVEVVDAFAIHYDYDNNKLVDETKPQFAKRMVAKYIKSIYQVVTAQNLSNAAYVNSLSTTGSVIID